MDKNASNSTLDAISTYFQNHSDAEKLIGSLKSKLKKDSSPEIALPLFLLLFARLENYLNTIIQVVIASVADQKGIEVDLYDLEEMTFGQALNIFNDIFVNGKLVLKTGKSKIRVVINFHLEKVSANGTKGTLLFQKQYLKKYVQTLKELKDFRNDLYHNLFSFNRGHNLKDLNINNMTKMILQYIDLDDHPQGTYKDMEFDEDYYQKLAKTKNFEKEVLLYTKSLIGKNGGFPPEQYVSINMLLRIMFYHYSFTFKDLKNGVHF